MKTPPAASFLAEEPRLIRELLWRRGIQGNAEAEIFLRPSYERDLLDPFLMKGMKEAVATITSAIKNNKRIAIFADYDCDGCAAAAILADFFSSISYKNFEVYVPERREGYGLTREAVVKLAAGGAELLLTVDCGIANYDEVEFAKGLGLEVVVTDHHLPAEVLPRCIVVNPKQPGCIYPEKMLCGAAVAFKLVCALHSEFPRPVGQEKWLLDLVALATLADQVPLRGENRALASFGLKVLNRTRRVGLQEIIKMLRLSMVGEEDISFSIVPRLNSVSRLHSSAFIFETLSTQNPVRAKELARLLETTNKERKAIVMQTMRAVKSRIAARPPGEVIVIGDPNWNLGILGLLANKIAEEYGRPAFVWTRVGDEIKGSCRGADIDLCVLMKKTEAAFLSFGGHKLAGGFTTTIEKVVSMEEMLAKTMAENNWGEDEKQTEEGISDGSFSLCDISEETLAVIDRLRPFGKDFAKPVFIFENVRAQAARRFGQGKNHLALTLTDGEADIEAVRFFEEKDSFPETMSVLASPERDWRGRPRLRIEKFL
jgi:single-stranded-DNA-specific exonuclease